MDLESEFGEIKGGLDAGHPAADHQNRTDRPRGGRIGNGGVHISSFTVRCRKISFRKCRGSLQPAADNVSEQGENYPC
jgi:hypothetical protein